MQPPYKARKPFDAELVYKTWLTLVAEEPLYEALKTKQHAEVARRLGLGDEEVLILDDFADQAGTRWHIDNLRFRCTTMVSRILKWHLPGTIQLLTRGSNDWLRDIAYEYMAHSRWQDFGHHNRGPECERFARFVRQRIMTRRRPPEHLEAVLGFELAVLELGQKASRLPLAEWPAAYPQTPVAEDSVAGPPLQAVVPRQAPVARTFELPVDIVSWLRKPEGDLRVDGPGPVVALIYVPSPAELPKLRKLEPSELALFQRCDGKNTVAELADSQPDRTELLRSWLAEGCLAQSAPRPAAAEGKHD